MQQYFAINKINDEFILSMQDNFHIEKVLRMKSHDEIIVIYEKEKYLCEVIFNKDVHILIKEKLNIDNELKTEINLIYGLPKKDKFELVIQKGCELGVSKIIPFIAKRSIPVLDEKNTKKKMDRWELIAKEACEQSKRNIVASIENPCTLKELLKYKSDLNIIAYEDLSSQTNEKLYNLLSKQYNSITIVVGPEGGFDKSEIEYLVNNGFECVSLGKRILRSETAPLYLLSVIAFMNER